MRPTHTVPEAGTYRELTIWKAFVFTILTLGIYFLVMVYQNTKDVQGARREPFSMWQLLFWLGILVPPLHVVLYVVNGMGLKELRQKTGQSESSTWVIALVLAFILAPVGEIIWAVHFNETVRTAAKAAPIPAAPTAQPMTAV